MFSAVGNVLGYKYQGRLCAVDKKCQQALPACVWFIILAYLCHCHLFDIIAAVPITVGTSISQYLLQLVLIMAI